MKQSQAQKDALERIRRRAEEQRLARAEPRFRNVLRRLVDAGLLVASEAALGPARVPRTKLRVEDVLWAGQFEPRMLEVLPALLAEQPELFRARDALPDDLERALDAVRFGLQDGAFRGIPWERLQRHLKRARPAARPAKLRAFRLHRDDELLLARLAHKLETNQTAALRAALRVLAEKVLSC